MLRCKRTINRYRLVVTFLKQAGNHVIKYYNLKYLLNFWYRYYVYIFFFGYRSEIMYTANPCSYSIDVKLTVLRTFLYHAWDQVYNKNAILNNVRILYSYRVLNCFYPFWRLNFSNKQKSFTDSMLSFAML